MFLSLTYFYSVLINVLLSRFADKMIIRMPINRDNDAPSAVRKLRGEKLDYFRGFASVVDLIDYKLVDPRSHPASIPREFRIQDLPLSHRARRVASV